MSNTLFIILIALVYLGGLFFVAHLGDKYNFREKGSPFLKTWIYPFALAVYCTSWTFYGSVGLAFRSGYEFIAIYIGPILLFTVFSPVIAHVIRVSKAQNISSAADFLGARFGKNAKVATLVCLISFIAMIPYIALQLKAISNSLVAMLKPVEMIVLKESVPFFGDLSLLVALSLALFAALFGTRHADATEHQEGLMLAIATESFVKLAAFFAVGFYVCYVMFNGTNEIFELIKSHPENPLKNYKPWSGGNFIAIVVLSLLSCLLLPRMFHVAVVENRSEDELKKARWLFPLYIIIINIFVLPVALAGMIILPKSTYESDMLMIALPLFAGNDWLTLISFIGGLSAATAMVIVATIALAIMASNDLILPLLFKWKPQLLTSNKRDMTKTVLVIRRTVIFVTLFLAFLYYRIAGSNNLASIGLLSFAAIAQLAPAFFGGLFWRGANARGAICAMVSGILVWAYTLMLPNLADTGVIDKAWLGYSLFGLDFLKPQDLLGVNLSPLANGTFWSLFINVFFFIVGSKMRQPNITETIQSQIFVPIPSNISPTFRIKRTTITQKDVVDTLSRYLGEARTKTAFENFSKANGLEHNLNKPMDLAQMRYAEHLLTSAIGTASSRLVISNLLKYSESSSTTLKLLDDAHAAMQYNKDVLQTALEHSRQGICVFDREHNLILWNAAFAELLDLPPEMVRVGIGYDEILRFLAKRGEFGEGEVEMRLERFLEAAEPYKAVQKARGLVIEIGTVRLPDGGIVATYTDVTESVAVAEKLVITNEALEVRVKERTEALEALNRELESAKLEADEANISKTRFLAAASHDILQPLNAARLYTTSLVERMGESENLAHLKNIDASLEAVEEILGALLDISRLDSGAMKVEWSVFKIDDLFKQLAVDFAPIAAQKGLRLSFVPTSLSVKSDRRLLRRILQNFISNALKYTQQGRVIVGARKRGDNAFLFVADQGIGIPLMKQKLIFKEFQRLDTGAKVATGLGLGLSIVERIAKILNHPLSLTSKPHNGATFGLTLPLNNFSQPTALQELSAPPLSNIASLHLVVVDNEEKILEGMKLLLTGWGCKVTSALKDSDILKLAPQNIDGLLVDYHLDNGNGIDAITRLREHFGQLPATLITADRSDMMRENAAFYDIHVLNKPLKPAALRALLTQWQTMRG